MHDAHVHERLRARWPEAGLPLLGSDRSSSEGCVKCSIGHPHQGWGEEGQTLAWQIRTSSSPHITKSALDSRDQGNQQQDRKCSLPQPQNPANKTGHAPNHSHRTQPAPKRPAPSHPKVAGRGHRSLACPSAEAPALRNLVLRFLGPGTSLSETTQWHNPFLPEKSKPHASL